MKNQAKKKQNGSYPNHPRVAVGAVVFKDDHVLLVLRGKPPSQNLWSIPGGRVRLGETLQEAAEREIKEETGLNIHAHRPLYTFDVIERDDNGTVRFHYVIVDLLADYTGGTLRPGDDALDVRWVSSTALRNLKVSEETQKLLNKHFNFGV